MASSIEIIHPPRGRRFRFVFFDFDGTLSLVREGWPSVMVPMMIEVLVPVAAGLPRERLEAMLRDDVEASTGRPTIDQMVRLAERVAEFGGSPRDPKEYKAEYNRRLLAHIARRREALAAGTVRPEEMLLAGARGMLDALAGRGLVLCCASGTDEPYVREEARLLDVARYFGPHVYGVRDDYEASSKAAIIEGILGAGRLAGEELLVFGDGFVEIEIARQAGGYAVGVASEEAAGGGSVNAWKRARLLAAGADMIIPDFAEHEELLRVLFPVV